MIGKSQVADPILDGNDQRTNSRRFEDFRAGRSPGPDGTASVNFDPIWNPL